MGLHESVQLRKTPAWFEQRYRRRLPTESPSFNQMHPVYQHLFERSSRYVFLEILYYNLQDNQRLQEWQDEKGQGRNKRDKSRHEERTVNQEPEPKS